MRLRRPSDESRHPLAAWAGQQTVAFPAVGRAGWLTLARTWRANGGRW